MPFYNFLQQNVVKCLCWSLCSLVFSILFFRTCGLDMVNTLRMISKLSKTHPRAWQLPSITNFLSFLICRQLNSPKLSLTGLEGPWVMDFFHPRMLRRACSLEMNMAPACLTTNLGRWWKCYLKLRNRCMHSLFQYGIFTAVCSYLLIFSTFHFSTFFLFFLPEQLLAMSYFSIWSPSTLNT